MNEIKKYNIYLNLVPVSATNQDNVVYTGTTTGGTPVKFGIIGSDNVVRDFYDKDFYINVPIFKNYKIEEYVDVKKEENIFSLERQQFNPYFIEFSFFDSIQRNKVNKGDDLNPSQISYIRSKRIDKPSTWTDDDFREWFDTNGKSELPWFKGTVNEVTIDMIDITGQTNTNIISKAFKYPIDINK